MVLSVYPGTPATPATPANIVQGLPDWASQITNTDTVAAVAQILQSPQGQQVSEHILPKSVYIRAACAVCVAVRVRRCLTYFVVVCYSSSSWCRVCRCSSRSPNRPCCRPWMLASWCSCKLWQLSSLPQLLPTASTPWSRGSPLLIR